MTIDQAFQLARDRMAAGRLADAEQLCRQILAADPRHADALNLLGLIAYQCRQLEPAEQLLRQAAALRQGDAGFLGNLGVVLRARGKCEEAVSVLSAAVNLQPQSAGLHVNLGAAFASLGDLPHAADAYRRALAIDPNLAMAHANLANTLRDLGQLDEAIVCYERALALQPNYANALNNLGLTRRRQGDLDAALDCYHRALAADPGHIDAANNLGNALKDAGQVEQAIDCFRHALARSPDLAARLPVHHNLLYTLTFSDRATPLQIAAEQQEWAAIYAHPLMATATPHRINRDSQDPNRPLRVGYISPDFRLHPVGRFLLQLFRHHDRAQQEIVCYDDTAAPDHITAQLKASADAWHSTTRLTDQQLADRIRDDRIDILIDLSLHMAGNRLLVFARKPAPLQISYLGYCGHPGLHTIDTWLADPYLEEAAGMDGNPPPVALTHTYWCYSAPGPIDVPPETSEPSPLPAASAGHITFGCLNNFCKVSPQAIATWAKILHSVPNSRVLLHALRGSHRQRTQEYFQSLGIAPDRIAFLGQVSFQEYLAAYRHIDIALDPFPYNGGTTTCDALWMGIPVISIAGQSPMGNASRSILANLGRPEWCAPRGDLEGYIQRAISLAMQLNSLSKIRTSLRAAMEQSPLMDGPAFARDMEGTLRRIWLNPR